MPSPNTHSDDDRATALQVWAFQARRSPTQTARILQRDHGITIPTATIRNWSFRYDWHTRARELFHDVSPGMLERVGFNLIQAAHDASAYLADVHAGHAEPDRERMSNALGLLDRIGFVPFSSPARASINPLGSTTSRDRHAADASDLAALDTATLQRLASGIVTTSDTDD